MSGFGILAIYAVIMITATLIFTKKEKNVERFCVGSRKENWIMSALSIAGHRHCSYLRKKRIRMDLSVFFGFWYQTYCA